MVWDSLVARVVGWKEASFCTVTIPSVITSHFSVSVISIWWMARFKLRSGFSSGVKAVEVVEEEEGADAVNNAIENLFIDFWVQKHSY